jgi:hypothetical protein
MTVASSLLRHLCFLGGCINTNGDCSVFAGISEALALRVRDCAAALAGYGFVHITLRIVDEAEKNAAGRLRRYIQSTRWRFL